MDSKGFKVSRLEPNYLENAIQTRLSELSDPTTDFKVLVHRRHFCDRSPIFDITSKHRSFFLGAPPGIGKTTTLSMIRQFYDISLKDDFHDVFRNTAVGRSIFDDGKEAKNRSNCFVMTLNFAKLKPLDPDFDFDVEVNEQLQQFLTRYPEFFGGLNIQIEKSAADTL
ncbi:hypothetical protein PM082_022545 [Marasmius tenuissimus]|nr:hypothetical protein PM082_022545 [Marasmius tenuissimus]